MNKYSNRLIKRCFSAGLIGVIMSCVGALITDRVLDLGVPLFGFILGFLTGVTEMYFLRRAKIVRTFLLVAFRGLIYTINIAFTIAFLRLIYYVLLSNVDPFEFNLYNLFLSLCQSAIICNTILLYLQLEAIVGVGIFQNFLLGRYHRPKKEWRYFMFIDLNNSTKMVETLGDDLYFSMLNTYFRDLSRPIFESGASIYKYMGDEVMLTWKDSKKFSPDSALSLYLTFKKVLESKREIYLSTYGVFPTFKAGFHYGEVISAKVGDLKKEIAYNGDVLNITSRIMERCKDFNQGIIMTDIVYNKLKVKPKNALEISDLKIEGKRDSVNVFGLR